MGERSSYAPGTFSWVDLSTTDLEGATSFYEGLFGWQHNDAPVGEEQVYRMFHLDGKDVAAASVQREEERSQGIPPHWNCYVTVTSADESAAKAAELGGTVFLEPFDVMDVGRMAVIADPTGAVLAVWEPRRHIGARIVNEPGALCWNELATNDVAAAKKFYEGLFGWSTEDMGDGAYTMVRVGDRTNGGIRPMGEMESGMPPNWLAYFAVPDSDESAAKAGELGGNAIVPPMDVPVGESSRIAVIADPQRAVFGIFSGPLDS
jgi:predicted enzyme related to lactoylglutathione lyase